MFNSGNSQATLDPEQPPARLEYETLPEALAEKRVAKVSIPGLEAGLPLFMRRYGRIINLPAPQKGIVYFTNPMVAMAAHGEGRKDVLGEDEVIFDKGVVTGFEAAYHDPDYRR